MTELTKLLSGNAYPGRGIALGRTEDGERARIVYFIMGRSVNSRNRVFEETADGLRTRAFDESKMTDPSLILYHPVRFFGGKAIVTNGDQTDTIRDALAAGHCFRSALRGRSFEPDGPNWTPRISGLVHGSGEIELSILKSDEGDPACCCRHFFSYDAPRPGTGWFISTYRHDGDPLPSFAGEPVKVSMAGDLDGYAQGVWAALDGENKVSLYVCDVDLGSGERRQRIFDRNGGDRT